MEPEYNCCKCNEPLRKGEEYYDREDNIYCEKCQSYHCSYCESCGEIVPSEDFFGDYAGKDICNRCCELFTDISSPHLAKESDDKTTQTTLELYESGELPVLKSSEVVNISTKALAKIMIHSLYFSGVSKKNKIKDFKMVMGNIAGNNKDNKVFIEDAYLMAHGDANSVKFEKNAYIKLGILSDKLFEKGLFFVGWYCSLLNNYDIDCNENYNLQLSYQQGNELAVAITVVPTQIESQNPLDSFKFFRLKDDLSRQWVELDFEVTDKNQLSLIMNIQNIGFKIKKALHSEDIEKIGYLDKYLESLEDSNL